MNGISKETFLKAEDSKNRDAMLFDMLEDISQKVTKLQSRKQYDTVISGVTGLIGGIIAVFAKWEIFR